MTCPHGNRWCGEHGVCSGCRRDENEAVRRAAADEQRRKDGRL